jgi:hypothetical protein
VQEAIGALIAGVIAALAFAGEATQLTVRLDDYSRVQTGVVDRLAELLDVFAHRPHFTPPICGWLQSAVPTIAGFRKPPSPRRASAQAYVLGERAYGHAEIDRAAG